MGINLEELGKKLHKNLDSGINKLKSAQTGLEHVGKETESVVQTKLQTAKASLGAKKEEAEVAKNKVEDFLKEKKTETKAGIDEWKVKHNIKKLEKRAEKAETHAELAIALALYYIEEAEVAIWDAVSARLDVDTTIENM